MRHGMMAVLAAALLAGAPGCKPQPKNQRMSVEQTPPFRSERDFAPEKAEAASEPAAVEVVKAEKGAKGRDEDANSAAPRQPATRRHVIVKGDTLYSLAKRYLGDGKRWKEIQAANPGLDPRRLRVGQEIVIPAK